MSIIVSQGSNKEFQKPSTGLVQAVCYAVWDIGLQKVNYKGVLKIQPKVIIAWEIDELIKEGDFKGKRLVKTKRFTASLGEKATLKKWLEQWRGKAFEKEELKGFDIEKFIGYGAMLNLVSSKGENGQEYINVGSISPLMKGAVPMVPENKPQPAPKWVTKVQSEAVSEDEAKELLRMQDEVAKDEDEVPF